jgi:hypothetical protein
LLVTTVGPVAAQTNGQLWRNLTFDWVRSKNLTLELDVEPKVLVAAPSTDRGWWTIDVTPSVEYALEPWLDVIGQLGTGYTRQTDEGRLDGVHATCRRPSARVLVR